MTYNENEEIINRNISVKKYLKVKMTEEKAYNDSILM